MEKNRFKVVLQIKPNSTEEDEILTYTKQSITFFDLDPFVYDLVLSPGSFQGVSEFITPYLIECFNGININIFGYSIYDTSFSLLVHEGIMNKSLSCLFNSQNCQDFIYFGSMIMITDERIYDLLQISKINKKLLIKKGSNKSVFVENLTEFLIESHEDCEFLMNQGFANNSFTRGDSTSIIFQIIVESRNVSNKRIFMKTKINFIDLPNNGNSFFAFKSCIKCLSNYANSIYKDSNLTQILSDSLNYNSLNFMISLISGKQEHAEKTLEALNFLKTFNKLEVAFMRNAMNSFNDETPNLGYFFKDSKKYKHKEISMQDSYKLNKTLKRKGSIEEIEALVNENKLLRTELQQFIRRSLAEDYQKHPDLLNNALTMTEDLIKKRKLEQASIEIKEKLLKQGRCQICTLICPCKHSEKDTLTITEKIDQSLVFPKSKTPTFITRSDTDAPKKYRIRSSRGKSEDFFKNGVGGGGREIKEVQKRLILLSKIEAYREEKLRKEIEKMENETKIEKESTKKNKEVKIKISKERKHKNQKARTRPQSKIRIKDYEYKKNMITEILKQQTHVIKKLKSTQKLEESNKVLDSINLVYNP